MSCLRQHKLERHGFIIISIFKNSSLIEDLYKLSTVQDPNVPDEGDR